MKVDGHEVIIRDATPADRAWICTTWKREIYSADVSKHLTLRVAHAIANALYDAAHVGVAEVQCSPPILVGFVARIDDEVAGLIVSHAFRGRGIGRMLLG